MRISVNLKNPFCRTPTRPIPTSLSATKRRTTSQKTSPMSSSSSGLKIAVEGCCHGELDTIYAALQKIEEQEQIKIDLLICCGDFQAVRNLGDLECMAVPDKYKKIMSFYKYYNGEVEAPVPTVFIGGNHEAVNYLRELYYGGWVAPKIYYLGYSGVVNFGGLRIAGLSGIFNERHYHLGHFEHLPYSEGTKRSAYHVRAFEVFKLLQIKDKVDVFLSHDWPHQVTNWGDKEELLRRKPHFRREVQDGCLGSPVATQLLESLQPVYHFAAHLHVKFPALVQHSSGKKTRFLALDKCLPRRDYLQILDIPSAKGPKEFQYDKEWLAILKSTNHLMSVGQVQQGLPHGQMFPKEEDKEMIEHTFQTPKSLKIPENFTPTAEGHNPQNRQRWMPKMDLLNPQTEQFLDMLELPYNLNYGNRAIQSSPKDLPELAELQRPKGSTYIDLDFDDE